MAFPSSPNNDLRSLVSSGRSCFYHIYGHVPFTAGSRLLHRPKPNRMPLNDCHLWHGAPSRTRTCDPKIKSFVLYQLSYKGKCKRFVIRFLWTLTYPRLTAYWNLADTLFGWELQCRHPLDGHTHLLSLRYPDDVNQVR